ncbi:MAG: hypothetical protein A3E88_02140 [Legionellales bacterium RIFCSPHIGHO2_12_FULL_35_11]|nr:MAG: hypothetical protein A3E88_02140 [Legionellales bacterium RIFCSPHIGHO2_12_FULL_35_11]
MRKNNINVECIKKLLITANYGSESQLFDDAILQAENIVNIYANIINGLVDYYQENITYLDSKQLFFRKIISAPDTLDKVIDAHLNTWQQLRDKMSDIYKRYELHRYPHHTLALLLNPNDEEFLASVENGNLPLGEEIGLIALQRLKEIAASNAACKKMKSTANHSIKMAMLLGKEGILTFHYEALLFEVAKLILYRNMYPVRRVIYLGTARAVEAVMKIASMDEGIGLGCPEAQYSWGLNRAWLQIAAVMGYSFQLVERHFPDMEAAICSGNTLQIIDCLANQIRIPGITSQYSRKDSPTATPQEVLSLMDGANYVGRKNPDTGILFLEKSKGTELTRKFSRACRAHSAPRHGGLFAPMPLPIGKELIAPAEDTSPNYRKSPTMDWDSRVEETDGSEIKLELTRSFSMPPPLMPMKLLF